MNTILKHVILTLALIVPSFGYAQIEPKAKIIIKYKEIEGKNNMDPSNSIESIGAQLKDKTSLEIVDNEEDAEFLAEYSLIKGFADYRHGKLIIKNRESGKVVFESKLIRVGANVYNGFNPTRGVAKMIVEKHLIKKYPSIKW